ncbi:transketolase [Plantactinospora sp. WMMC1484]|uniref:transketolase n=1 Tax=Plantactinospora sp. WMMC1484 TaxID=3404122 RepID=UPI003BF51F1C
MTSNLDHAVALARQFQVDSVRMTSSAGSGHPTSSASAAELLSVLVTRHLRYDWSRPQRVGNDHLIFSKGHASPLLYSVFKAAGVVSDDDLMTKYRRAGSALQGHPTPELPWVDVATGSLGQGLPIGVGVAQAARVTGESYRVWVLCGDSELAEGSVWEALDTAARFQLGNLTVVADINRLGQVGPTELQWDMDRYVRRVEAFGCTAIVVDGHDVAEVDRAYTTAAESDGPVVILARTKKGHGYGEVENADNWHGKPLPAEIADQVIEQLGGVTDLRFTPLLPESADDRPERKPQSYTLPQYELGAKVAVRKAFGDTLVALGSDDNVVVADAEVGNSTYTLQFAAKHGDRFFQTYIAEQQMVATCVGMDVAGLVPYAATFAAFLSRAYDFVRMAGVSGVNIRLCGTHAGVEIGEDGPSQMALEDLAAMRAVRGSTVLYPSDATSTAKLTAALADREGVSYLRATRGAYPVIYGADDEFPIGGSRLVRSSDDDVVTVIAAGVTVHLALQAAETLAAQGVQVSVLDAYSIKPIDDAALARSAERTPAGLVVVEDHYPEGGLGSAVLESLARQDVSTRVRHLAVQELPGSGTSVALFGAAGISPESIAAAVQELAPQG